MFSTITCSEGSSAKWIDRVAGRAVCAAGNASFCAVGVANGDLYIMSTTGRRLFPCIGTIDTLYVVSTGCSLY